tara:strand:- start:562 stop:825 length:264 start_codon:yes stop_codon:yes gene_type:complete
MDIKSNYQHMMAQQPLELIHKTQMAKDFQMEQVVKQRRWVEQTTAEPHKAMRKSYEGHNGTYDAAGKVQRGPQPVEGAMSKSVDVQA